MNANSNLTIRATAKKRRLQNHDSGTHPRTPTLTCPLQHQTPIRCTSYLQAPWRAAPQRTSYKPYFIRDIREKRTVAMMWKGETTSAKDTCEESAECVCEFGCSGVAHKAHLALGPTRSPNIVHGMTLPCVIRRRRRRRRLRDAGPARSSSRGTAQPPR